ncbi:GAF and ANTAR domain-containing protein [Streptomyces beijiangensis]|uniref:GAF and ANTAR domain-containing protein n=1 Tax=Streptomyces beijiangensis TaxID=163361 RepID=A0A939F297_9ACTN|nr:GAF and ANTAR domain-containing protein [Streptomyces beijiangensis]MBO0510444.1 GAF and ANTAR domain-containing protein [Streptomyces beijiangensis]
MPREQLLSKVFLEVADSLVADFDVLEFLQQFAEHCTELLDVAAAGILLGDEKGHLQLLAASDEHTRLLEVFASQSGQGPCVDCYLSGRPRIHIDLTDPDVTLPWPQFTTGARAIGFTVVNAFPLRLRERVIGALGLFQTQPGHLSDEDVLLAQALADMATIGILQQRTLAHNEVERSQLQYALTSRIILEQVKGILAERWQVSVDEAFNVLRAYARAHNQRLTQLALAITTGTFDTDQIPHTAPSPTL